MKYFSSSVTLLNQILPLPYLLLLVLVLRLKINPLSLTSLVPVAKHFYVIGYVSN